MHSGRMEMGTVSRTLSKGLYPSLNRAGRRQLFKVQQEFKRNYNPDSFIGPQNAPTSSQEPQEAPSKVPSKGTHLGRMWTGLKSFLHPRRNS